MKPIIILEGFDGYPDGVRRRFVAGERVEDLSDDYAALIVGKGLGSEIPPEHPAPAVEPTITKPARQKGEAKRTNDHEDE